MKCGLSGAGAAAASGGRRPHCALPPAACQPPPSCDKSGAESEDLAVGSTLSIMSFCCPTANPAGSSAKHQTEGRKTAQALPNPSHPGQKSTRAPPSPPPHSSSGAAQPCHCSASSGFMAHTKSPEGACKQEAAVASELKGALFPTTPRPARAAQHATWCSAPAFHSCHFLNQGQPTLWPAGRRRHFWHSSHCTHVSACRPAACPSPAASASGSGAAAAAAVAAAAAGVSAAAPATTVSAAAPAPAACTAGAPSASADTLRRCRLIRFASASGSCGSSGSADARRAAAASSLIGSLAARPLLRVRRRLARLLRLRVICAAEATSARGML